MECKEIKEKLVAFVDKELSQEEAQIIQQHLKDCADCSKELESFLEIKNISRVWKSISPSIDWKVNFKKKMAKLQEQPSTEIEILKSAVIGLSRRVRELEEAQSLMHPMLDSQIMTVEELARYLRLSVDQIYEMIDQLPKFQVGYEYRFRRESIDEWVRTLEQKPYTREYTWGNWYTEEEE